MQVERAKKEQDQKEIPTIDDVMLKETVRNGKKSLLSTLFSTSWLWKCAAVPLSHKQPSATHAAPCPRYRVQLLVGAIAVYFLGKLRFFNGVVRVVRMLPKQPMAAWLAILHVRFLGGGGGAVEAAAKLAAPG
eukprot:COSAG04_NODE_585_length_12348_cov_17.357907_3_plen_133_part_00